METVFLTLINMSITASFLVLAILLIRSVFRRVPRWIVVALWALVGVRLVCPFTVQSALSVIPTTEAVPPAVLQNTTASVPLPPDNTATVSSVAAINPMQVVFSAMLVVWITAMLSMIGYAIFSYVRLRMRLREAVQQEANVWMCDGIDAPFILGVIRPRIYLPSVMDEQDRPYVLAHERAHLHRGDHLWKPLGFLLLSVYCFNPLIWIAYGMLCRDIEIACDEKVIRECGENGKRSYAKALIRSSVPRRLLTACPLAFGETAIKERVASVLSFRKPTVWILLTALLISAVVTMCFLTDPREDAPAVNTPTVTTTAQALTTTAAARSTTTAATTTMATTTTTVATVAPTTTTAVTTTTTVAPSTAAPVVTTTTVTTVAPTTTTTAVSVDENAELQIVSITPYEVSPGGKVTVTVRVNSQYEIQSLGLHLYRGKSAWSLNHLYDTVPFTLTEGDSYNGIYTATYTIAKDALPMPWYIGIGGTKLDHSTETSDYPYPEKIPILFLPTYDKASFVVTE